MTDVCVRIHISIDRKLLRRVEEFASRSSISRSSAISELLNTGLDGELAGIESSLAIQQKLSRELNSLRGLVIAAVDSSDVACMLSLFQMIHAGDIQAAEALSTFVKARGQIGRLKQVKKQEPVNRKVPDEDLMEGLEDD